MTGQLTTHVLDLVLGSGAGGMSVVVRRLGPEPQTLAEVSLDAGGRAMLLSGEDFPAGQYELVFEVGAYHRTHGFDGGVPAFLDEVPIRFGVADAGVHWHVPLLVSHYGYSTYRGG